MEQNIIILGLGKPYSFEATDGGKMEGVAMHYIATDNLNPVEFDGVLGTIPCKETMPISFYDRAKAQGIPCTAKARFVMRNVGGKQVLKIEGLDFINENKKTA